MLEAHIRRDVGEVSPEELRAAIAGMVFIDICMRSYFRGEIIKSLVEEEIPVHVFGANWDKLDCKKKEYLIPNGREVDSVTCARAIADARISLNIMPWFKDGAHDRVFTAMLQHTLSLTDDSKYLREIAADGKERTAAGTCAGTSGKTGNLCTDRRKRISACGEGAHLEAESGNSFLYFPVMIWLENKNGGIIKRYRNRGNTR